MKKEMRNCPLSNFPIRFPVSIEKDGKKFHILVSEDVYRKIQTLTKKYPEAELILKENNNE